MKQFIRRIKMWFLMWRISSLGYNVNFARSEYEREWIQAKLLEAIHAHQLLAKRL